MRKNNEVYPFLSRANKKPTKDVAPYLLYFALSVLWARFPQPNVGAWGLVVTAQPLRVLLLRLPLTWCVTVAKAAEGG